jgi:homoserine dehydrogenase
LASITGILAQNEISIESIVQKNVNDPGKVSIVVITEKILERKAIAALEAIDALPNVVDKSRMIRFLM